MMGIGCEISSIEFRKKGENCEKKLIPSGSGKLKYPGILRSHNKPVIWSFLQGHCPEVTSQMKLADPSSLQLHSENIIEN